MPSNSIPHYLYKRNHTWWFRKRFVSQGNAIEYRLSLQTASFQRARLLALRLQTLCQQMVASLGAPKKQKNGVMEKSAQEQIKAKLRAKIAEWTAEETEHWFCGSARNEGDLNDYLETLDMVVSDLKERIAYDDKPSLHRAEASTVLDELPHLKATLTEYDYQVIARMVAQAKVKSLQATRAIILGGNADWLSITSPAPTTPFVDNSLDTPTLSELLQMYAKENKAKGHSKRTQKKYEWYGALILSSFGDVPVHTISGAMGREFYDNLSKLPMGLQKEVLLASKLNQLIETNTEKSISLVTASAHHGKINQFFDWVVDKKHISSSPFPSKSIPMPKKNHKDDRASITDAEAKRVFSHTLFTDHHGIKTKLVQHPHHFFLPLICLVTGMRAGEVSQLYIDDIVDVDGVFCFLIDKRRDDQWLKTPNAKRFIPIHHELIKLGFLDFIKDLKKKFTDDTRLFHNIPLIQDSYSAKPSEWFIRNFRDSLGQPSHVTLHGFRHMFRDKLVNLTDSEERICRLMGHQLNSYGNSLLADQRVMQQLVNSINFSGIISDVRPYTSLNMFHQLKGRA
ncbi:MULTISPECIES: tyrosine-type recombinase/integrase [Enterobacter cloacae complex]|uniref:tyrosine-type recombinase/integrase n=2 Tax=Enterobacter cloacae complex TaxID=354276 RepID=UPI0009942893|nr:MULTISPECIES: tyrosine-type recombinase/integrase [Enterobacter cloacae complex]OOV77137.1 hypothetical protein B1742_04140 [Enterobacter kobei]BBT46128.1 hypothetical protein WP8W18C04_32860 [Enterobacter cloacae]HDT5934299.1 tyrosine-type recombinase/integrase [Enterobacter kobei]HED5620528.1 tyrosine-type recombinase/integrase [Enterobacter cloacae]